MVLLQTKILLSWQRPLRSAAQLLKVFSKFRFAFSTEKHSSNKCVRIIVPYGIIILYQSLRRRLVGVRHCLAGRDHYSPKSTKLSHSFGWLWNKPEDPRSFNDPSCNPYLGTSTSYSILNSQFNFIPSENKNTHCKLILTRGCRTTTSVCQKY